MSGEVGVGKIGVGLSVAFILIVLVDYSSYIKGLREIASHRDNSAKLNEIISKVYLSKFILLVSVLALFFVLVYFTPYFQSDKKLFLFSSVIVVAQFFNPTWILQGLEDFKTISILNVVSKLIYVIGVFCFVNFSYQYVYVNLLWGLGLMIPSVWVMLVLFDKFHISIYSFKLKPAINLIKEDFIFCLSQLMFSLRQYSPIIMIDLIAGNLVAGQYKIIEQIIMLFRTYFQMIFRFSFSVVCYEVTQNLNKGLITWKKINGFSILFVFILITLMFVFSEEVILFFNVDSNSLNQFNSWLKISLVLPILIGFSLAQEQLIFSFGLDKKYEMITIIITVLSFLFIFLGLQFYALTGVILALLLTESILIGIYYFLVRNHHR